MNELQRHWSLCIAMRHRDAHRKKVLFVENNDSFSWNVIDCLPVSRRQVCMVDASNAIQRLPYTDVLVIGPGPTNPMRVGLVKLVHAAEQSQIPTLGICIGHQALGMAFGARLVRTVPMHGKTARVVFSPSSCFPGIEGHLEAMRYHSLSLEAVPPPLVVVAKSSDETVMAIEHNTLRMAGLQFHPDSYATPRGRELLAAFFDSLE